MAAQTDTYSLWLDQSSSGDASPVDELRAAFGKRVRELRNALDVSQEELAHRAGVHYTYLGGIERGERNPSLVNIGRLSAALKVPLADLFSVFPRVLTPPKRKARKRLDR